MATMEDIFNDVPDHPTIADRMAVLHDAATRLKNGEEMSNDLLKAVLLFAGIGLLPKLAGRPSPTRSYLGQNNLPLGMRNNNPGNLIGTTQWQGLEEQNTTPGIQKFKNWLYGTRAMLKVLHHYYYNDQLQTISAILSKYAPYGHGSNDPGHYANKVEEWTGIPKNQRFSWTKSTVFDIAKAIFRMEQGTQYANQLTNRDLQSAWNVM